MTSRARRDRYGHDIRWARELEVEVNANVTMSSYGSPISRHSHNIRRKDGKDTGPSVKMGFLSYLFPFPSSFIVGPVELSIWQTRWMLTQLVSG
jgi:hypothetical protein